ncbi:MAG: RrF2 family transcriptional regulator [Christensenellales bacterium]
MKVSTKGQYGIRAMFDLANQYEQGPVPINRVAAHQGVSVAYLEQLFAVLRKAGLVNSVRGAQGGFELAKLPKDITLGEILRALEGEMAPVKCVTGGTTCEKSGTCPSQYIWQRLNDKVNAATDSITLQNMLEEYQATQTNENL